MRDFPWFGNEAKGLRGMGMRCAMGRSNFPMSRSAGVGKCASFRACVARWIRARAHQQNGAEMLLAAGEVCGEILVRTNVRAQAQAASSHKGKNELRCFGLAQGNAPPVLEVLRQVVSNSRLLRQFIPKRAEALMRDLDEWEAHPKFVLLRDIVPARLPSAAGYAVSDRPLRMTPRPT
jgi:hypothetical protein